MKILEVNQVLLALNEKLKQVNESRTIAVCGGAAMILSGFNRHETQDIDLLRPNRDVLLQRISKEISSESGSLRENWLNSDSAIFLNDSIPKNWELRLIEKVKLSNLTVKVLSLNDILHSKICAHIDREMDEQDIQELVSDDEVLFKKISQRVLSIKRFNNNTSRIIISELETRLGFND